MYVSRCVVTNVLDYDIEFKSLYHVHFQTNAFEKDMNPLIPQL